MALVKGQQKRDPNLTYRKLTKILLPTCQLDSSNFSTAMVMFFAADLSTHVGLLLYQKKKPKNDTALVVEQVSFVQRKKPLQGPFPLPLPSRTRLSLSLPLLLLCKRRRRKRERERERVSPPSNTHTHAQSLFWKGEEQTQTEKRTRGRRSVIG